MYDRVRNTGAPLRSQAQYHNAGAVPARGDDASDLAHQQLAVNTAMAASMEWISKVEENADARKAIESAKGWNLKTSDPHLAKELQAGIITEMALSCAAGKWDGDDPPGDRGAFCGSVLERKMNSVGSTSGSTLASEIIGLATNVAMPYALNSPECFGTSMASTTCWNDSLRNWNPIPATAPSPKSNRGPWTRDLRAASPTPNIACGRPSHGFFLAGTRSTSCLKAQQRQTGLVQPARRD